MQTQDHQPTDCCPAAKHRGNPFAVRPFRLALLAACFAAVLPGSGRAAEPRRPPVEIPFADPQKMFDRMFGPDTEEDEKALSRVEISIPEERQMGETAVAAFLADLKQRGISVASRGKDVQYLHDLVETVRPLMTNGKRYRSIRIYLAQSSDCEARTFPGGTIIFFRGLLELGGSEAAVVGIVGHELAHLDRGHVLKRARRLKLAQQAFSGGGSGFSPQRFMEAGTQFTQLWTRPFSHKDEAVADGDGARWAYQVGYDPREMAKLFLMVGQRQKNQHVPMPTFFQSHPDPKSRHDAVMKLYAERQQAAPNNALYVGKENLRLRVARSHRKFAE
ncbi:MAG: M48 family metallopeptidase [Thermoguttaceae bacterium]